MHGDQGQRYAQATAELSAATGEEARARQVRDELDAALDGGSVSFADVARANAELRAAHARVARARVQMQAAQEQLTRSGPW